MRKVISRQYTVDRGKLKFFFFVFLLFTVYYLLSTTVHAQSVDLLWQGETYTPPFYKGRALWSSHSNVTFLAIPHDLGNPENLNYKWSRNGDGVSLPFVSGLGKNTFTFSDGLISRTKTVMVNIIPSDQDPSKKDTVLASASVTLTPRPPILAVYENNPLYGLMFHKEIGEIHELQEREATLTAFPLFFSALNRVDSMIGYEWRTNAGGQPDTANSVTYRAPDGTDGLSAISVRASNKEEDKFMQSASKNFLIQFGK